MDAIVAVDARWGIGRDGGLLFRISADLRRFKALTMGHTVVMGRRTLQSLPGGAWPAGPPESGAVPAGGPCPEGSGGVPRGAADAGRAGEDAFVIGGESVYRALLDRCGTAYVTKILAQYPADRYFPDLDADPRWESVEESELLEENGVRFRYVTYRRRQEA